MPLTDERRQVILDTLKHCSADTLAAAFRYPDTHSDDDLHTLILGVLHRGLPENRQADLSTATDDSRITEDIGMDSFGMIDVVMTAEEVLGISIDNNELRGIATLGELKQFLKGKAALG